MSEPALRRAGGIGSGALGRQPDSLADVLERVLDKGIVIAGDIVVNVLDIELLTLKLRLFVSSAETAREMGMDWWSRDPFFSGRPAVDEPDEETRALRERVAQLEELVRRAGLDGGEQREISPDGQRS
ncbi:gas vesicle protein [Geodermatophilus sp. SYSU D00815]